MGDELKFPKRRAVKMDPQPGAADIEVQLVAAIGRIADGIQDIQNTLDVLVAVIAMPEEQELAPTPAAVVGNDTGD